jgi:hypothetical protein
MTNLEAIKNILIEQTDGHRMLLDTLHRERGSNKPVCLSRGRPLERKGSHCLKNETA